MLEIAVSKAYDDVFEAGLLMKIFVYCATYESRIGDM